MSRRLVAYFSASGITAKAAGTLAAAAGADLYEIRPAVPYTKADLDWTDKKSRSTLEMNDTSARPKISGSADMEEYDVVFLGFPIWWYREPSIIDSFVEQYDFSGKIIVLFATSGGSGFGSTAQRIRSLVSPKATVVEGKLLNGRQTEKSLTAWVEQLGL